MRTALAAFKLAAAQADAGGPAAIDPGFVDFCCAVAAAAQAPQAAGAGAGAGGPLAIMQEEVASLRRQLQEAEGRLLRHAQLLPREAC